MNASGDACVALQSCVASAIAFLRKAPAPLYPWRPMSTRQYATRAGRTPVTETPDPVMSSTDEAHEQAPKPLSRRTMKVYSVTNVC